MIIFGTRGVKFKIDQGEFHCPQCATQRAYKHKKVRRFFTLYFIPIIPLDSLGDFVECQACKGTFVSNILDYKPELGEQQFQSEYEKAMRHCMIMMMLADGEIDENEMDIVLNIINKFGHNDMSMEELEELVDVVEMKNEPVEKYLTRISPQLNEHGKEIIIKCAIAVASSDGHIDDSEIEMIQVMAEVMEMSKYHIKGLLSEIADKPTNTPTFSDN